MNTIEINGVHYQLASLMQRFVAQFLDSIVPVVIVVVASLLFNFSGAVIGAVVAGLYYLFQDGLSGGQSYGKRLMKTAVIDARTGEWCSFLQSFVRNLLLGLLSFIDWIFIFGSKRQRLGDMLAGTAVIRIDEITDRT